MPPASRRKAVKVGLLFLLGIVVYAFVSLVLQGQQVQLTSPAAASAPAPTPSKAPDEKFVDHTGASDPRATVCLTMGYHSRIGGTEDWCRSFVKLFHNHPQYRIHMVAAYTFHASALQWYLERGILFSREPTQFGKQCDIILATGTLLPEVAWRNAVTILVLHGGDTVFNFFMGHNPQYHELVAVSMGAISKGIAGNTRVIHAPIELGACDSTQKDFDVVYVGRITLSKDFGYFCEILEHLGDDVRVAAFGPNYANEKFTPRCTAVSMGSSNNVQRELCRAKVLLVPTKAEGGPLVAAYAWALGVPVMMHNTGIAASCQECYARLTGDAAADAATALSIVRGADTDPRWQRQVQSAARHFEAHFRPQTVLRDWVGLFQEFHTPSIMIDPETDPYVYKKGSLVIIQCVEAGGCTCPLASSAGSLWVRVEVLNPGACVIHAPRAPQLVRLGTAPTKFVLESCLLEISPRHEHERIR